jgi:tetratricopeptide (TPR) repeat protein
LAGRGEFDEALIQYRKALEIKPDYPDVYYNIGNVLAGRHPHAGTRVDEALAHYQKALDLASAQHNRALVEAIRARIRQSRGPIE